METINVSPPVLPEVTAFGCAKREAFGVALSKGGGSGGVGWSADAFFAGGPSTGVGGVRALAVLASASKRGLAERPLPLGFCLWLSLEGGKAGTAVARGPVPSLSGTCRGEASRLATREATVPKSV